MARDKGRMRMRMRAGAVLRIDTGAWVSSLFFVSFVFPDYGEVWCFWRLEQGKRSYLIHHRRGYIHI